MNIKVTHPYKNFVLKSSSRFIAKLRGRHRDFPHISYSHTCIPSLPSPISTSPIRVGHLFSSVQLFSHVWLFEIPWTAACQVSLSITNSQSLLKSHWCHPTISSCRPLLLLPSVFPSIGVFSNESVLRIRWPKYWSLSFSISPSSEYSELISFRID